MINCLKGAEFEVGPDRENKTLQEITGKLRPGDRVMVDGGATYPGGITLGGADPLNTAPIWIKGVPVAGKRPLLSGVSAPGQAVLRVTGSHYVIEGFDLTAGGDARAARCFYNVGDDVTLRKCVVHDCPFTGIAGSDTSGSLTLDHVEVYHCGSGLYAHQIYVGSSLARYPNALFRMTGCYVHDGAGGNNVKSRVTRNEIEYNWIEGAMYHELDLIGPDGKAQSMPAAAHCDAIVMGNVLLKTDDSKGTVARFGSDGNDSSRGAYEFVNNTVIVKSTGAAKMGLFWIKGQVGKIVFRNNVFWSEVGPMSLLPKDETNIPTVGISNWVPDETMNIPATWFTLHGGNPGFIDPAAGNYWPAKGSPLIGSGKLAADALVPAKVPPTPAGLMENDIGRPSARARDIGAFPYRAQAAQMGTY